VRAHYDSIHGRIASAWKLEGGHFDLDVTIPANTTATVYLPARDVGSITESGKDLAQAQGVKFLRTEGDRAVLAVESGAYRFVATP
jgi:alpha-L-rhamnosidase